MLTNTVDQLAINTIRTLSIDAVEKAKSGHPGLPMGAAPMAYVLWTRWMKHNPENPQWFNRDRFILSAGHGSMLLYSLLHLCGYGLTIEDLKNFRQWDSLTPGHPEYGHGTPGVEATTGPLGQGIAMAVGMAMAERHLAALYNRHGHEIVDHYTYALCGDGDLMEGVSAEAASLAGHLKLGRLIVLYDSNEISLDGETALAFTEDVGQRFEAYGWQVLKVSDGNDLEAIDAAIKQARATVDRPSLIEVRTVIGFGSPNLAGTSQAHGAPLGPEEIQLTKQAYHWPYEPFYVPQEVQDLFADVKERGAAAEAEWSARFTRYREAFPELAEQFDLGLQHRLPAGWDAHLPIFSPEDGKVATREASSRALNAIAATVPFFLGGSADLASSNKTTLKDEAVFSPPDYQGRNIWFGVREHAMGAILNGMALHGGLRVYGGTFFVFSDYLRPAMRLSALMKVPVIYVLTHDSIAVGEDGPTHQPIEHLAAIRAIPGITVLRPADANETMAAYHYAMRQHDGPVAMVLSRQGLPVLQQTAEDIYEKVSRGAYVISDSADPQALLIATGSEVSLALDAQQVLKDKGISTRVVSMPSWELFEKQPQAYKDHVLPPHVTARVAVEMGHPLGWERYVGERGRIMGITQFGASAPGNRVMEAYGFTVQHVVDAVESVLS